MENLAINVQNTVQLTPLWRPLSSPLSSPANSPSKKLVKDAINILTFEDVGDFITSRITNDTCYYVYKALKIADSKTDLGTNHLNGFKNLLLLKLSLIFRGEECVDILAKKSIYEEFIKSLSDEYKHKAKHILDVLEDHLESIFSSEEKNNLNKKTHEDQIDTFDDDSHDEVHIFNLVLNINSLENNQSILNEQIQSFAIELGGKIYKIDSSLRADFIAD